MNMSGSPTIVVKEAVNPEKVDVGTKEMLK
jgi:hypothetical protein